MQCSAKIPWNLLLLNCSRVTYSSGSYLLPLRMALAVVYQITFVLMVVPTTPFGLYLCLQTLEYLKFRYGLLGQNHYQIFLALLYKSSSFCSEYAFKLSLLRVRYEVIL